MTTEHVMERNPQPVLNGQHAAHDSALSVGSTDDGASKVRELEQEVQYLAEKANSASQRFADYENEIRVLQARLRQQERRQQAPDNASSAAAAASPSSASPSPITPGAKPGISRFGSFMGARRPVPEPQPAASSASREKDLEAQLVKEQTARIAAEKKVREVNAEIEELSASLFQQANEMVANARAESAKLKEKIRSLEADPAEKENVRLRSKLRTLEERDAERQRRLNRLEAANKRIERVRALLIPR